MNANYTLKNGYNSFKPLSNTSVFVFLKTLNFLLVLLLSFNTFAQSAKCIATLKVAKDRNTSSTSPEGARYNMILSNNGPITTNYLLSAININSDCTNNDGSSSSENANLTASFTDGNANSISEISLIPGEAISFTVTVNVPIGTAVNKWNCTEIKAIASTCPNYNVSIILHTLVSDPSQE